MRRLLSLLSLSLLPALAPAQTPWIIGGSSAAQGQFPWVGALMHNGSHQCGAALIDSSWVITAAHCVFDPATGLSIAPQAMQVRLNAVSTTGALPTGGVTARVKRLIYFPKFSLNQFEAGYDIALVQLDTAITTITPIALAAIGDSTTLYTTGSAVRVAGWGLEDTVNYSQPAIMKWCSTQVYDFALCSALAQTLYNAPVSRDQFCAGYKGGQTASGAAAGDSGGPIWREQGTTKTLLGVVSGGFGPTTRADMPGMYTRVTAYRSWIDSVMGKMQAPPQGIAGAVLDESTVRVGTSGEAIRLSFGAVRASGVHLLLLAADGRPVYQARVPNPAGQTYTIATAALPAGLYVLRVFDPQSGACVTQKLLHAAP